MPEKYLQLDNGQVKEKAASDASAGAGDAGKIPALGSAGRLSPTMMPAGIAADSASIQASEALSAGNVVNVFDDAGTTKVRKADAAAGHQADGYVLDAVAMGQSATVFFEGRISGLVGLSIGARYYLSAATPGGVTAVPVAGATEVHQYIGKAFSATEIAFEASDVIVRA